MDLDDGLILSATEVQYVKDVERVLGLFLEAVISINLKKWVSLQHQADYLGYTILPGKLVAATKPMK